MGSTELPEHTQATQGPKWKPKSNGRLAHNLFKLMFVLELILAAYIGYLGFALLYRTASGYSTSRSAPQIRVTAHPSCADAAPIAAPEFHTRQSALAQTLHKLKASAFITEPGASGLFYTNISSSTWHLSERPLLLVISHTDVEGKIVPKLTVLTPEFEATRAGLLPIPSADEIEYVSWPESSNPYDVAAKALSLPDGPVYVDGGARFFVAEGLSTAFKDRKVSSPPVEVADIRSQKSAAELQIMKCVNEVTLEAIRAVHKRMHIGMKESQASRMMTLAFAASGLQNGGCLTLFGENAALPHGSGTDRALSESDFALFDCTASLHGYWSDVTRTVALKSSQIPSDHLKIWYLVRSAQTAALGHAKNGTLTGSVDRSARTLLEATGYGEKFTHRLGHGIGLEVHERPYLVAQSTDVIKVGHTFSDEPGVYIEGDVGVRLEDCFYIDEHGEAVFLTEGAGGQAKSPWSP